MIIAIDGPAGTGKSTIASMVAKELGVTYLNSGSFYRALTLSLLDAGFDLDNVAKCGSKIVDFCKQQILEYVDAHMFLNGKDVENILHDDRVSKHVAHVSSIVDIRHFVNNRMQEITKSLSIVCEGRDMTTVVFPNADYKFYLDASIEEQAKRRFNQGVSNMTLEEVKKSIEQRDAIDKGKSEGALKIAQDARYIDTTHLTINEVLSIILRTVKGSK